VSQRRNSKNRQSKPVEAANATVRAQESSAAVSRRAQRRLQEERDRKRRMMMMIGGAIALAVIVVGALIFLNRPDDEGDASDVALTIPPPRDASIPQDGRALGNPDAPLTIVEYADFQCPACGTFATTVEDQLIQDYIATGEVRLVYHDFPFLDDRSDSKESDAASEAAFCAQDQGQFWAYHDMLFYNQEGENRGAFARDRLIEMARNVEGINVDQFTTCIDGDEYEDDVQALYQETIDAGVRSTPTFMMNGQAISGTNYPALQEAIEAALGNQ
jgi:protein-disulfide isomerase/predicted nucleic acid-binding Zn ribbon protein